MWASVCLLHLVLLSVTTCACVDTRQRVSLWNTECASVGSSALVAACVRPGRGAEPNAWLREVKWLNNKDLWSYG